ncbi:MAG TPA: hypothetical protein DCL38_08960 [Lachnospiraceae bacterium]|nr:hypothetical protein [Lachnospiraceae bacterium]
MKLPKDWDKPDKHNNELCRLFQKGTFPCGSFSLPYRFFSPEGRGSGKKLPLAVYLHGADAIGTDNELQLSMHDIGTMLALPSWQERHPCYILAPQYGPGQYWSDDYVKRGLLRLIHALAERPGTDENRIYIYGYSAGGVGTLRLVKENPGLFAAALSICGATNAEGLDELVKTPLWLVHAADDEIVKASYHGGESVWAVHYGSRDIYEALKDKHEDLRYTEFKKGEMKKIFSVNPHCSWVAVSDRDNDEFREWLFSRSKSDI